MLLVWSRILAVGNPRWSGRRVVGHNQVVRIPAVRTRVGRNRAVVGRNQAVVHSLAGVGHIRLEMKLNLRLRIRKTIAIETKKKYPHHNFHNDPETETDKHLKQK